jgi:hypothetical protein
VALIEAAGAEPFVGDPDRVVTLVPALDHVSVVCILLGSAEEAELHGPRLEMLLRRVIDTTVHAVVYETPTEAVASGAELVRQRCEHSRIPYALLDTPSSDHEAWLAAALAAVERLVE